MKREVLIKKWLDNELNLEELEVFKQLEDYTDLIRLSQATKRFKSEKIDTNLALNKLNEALKRRSKKKSNWVKPLLRIAAVITICFSVYYYTNTLNTNISTQIAQKEIINLPDHSLVTLNAKSSVTFNNNWNDNRYIKLEGEAYFKVAKGETFKVETTAGLVTVLGTEFNVKDRAGIFEVICYEGAVKVDYKKHSTILKPGHRFLFLDNTLVNSLTFNETKPFWINNESAFKSIPYKQVIAEFERQYNVSFNVNTINTNQLFTGSFAHNNIEVALKAITLPLNITFTKNNKKISLKRE